MPRRVIKSKTSRRKGYPKRSYSRPTGVTWLSKLPLNPQTAVFATRQTFHYNYVAGPFPGSYDIYSGTLTWANNNYAGNVTLNKLPNSNKFTNLFDRYRIKQVTLNFYPSMNVENSSTSAATTSGQGVIPTICIAPDVDGRSAAPGSEAAVMQYPGCKKLYMDRPRSFTFRPRVSAEVYANNTLGIGYSTPKGGQWIDCNNNDVPHYGWVLYMDTSAVSPYNAGVNSCWACKVTCTVDLEFKDVQG